MLWECFRPITEHRKAIQWDSTVLSKHICKFCLSIYYHGNNLVQFLIEGKKLEPKYSQQPVRTKIYIIVSQ